MTILLDIVIKLVEGLKMSIKEVRTIIVGDIHGCIDEFNELINTVSYNKNTDRMILAGDLIDRGPDSIAVVSKARKMDLECVMGNHEAKFLRWFNSSKNARKIREGQDYYSKLSDDDIDYIFRMPTYINLGDIIVVHAGLKAGISLDRQSKDDLMSLRYTDLNGNFISLRKIHKAGGVEALDAHFWTEFWKGPESIVYGHNVHSMESPLIEEVAPNVKCYGIDTGCCFGGRLSCLILPTFEIVQVPAKHIYHKSGFDT